jgi:hypothetical protein
LIFFSYNFIFLNLFILQSIVHYIRLLLRFKGWNKRKIRLSSVKPLKRSNILKLIVRKGDAKCLNLFLGYFQIHFLFFHKKKSKQCCFERHYYSSSPTCAEAGKREIFKSSSPALSLSPLTLPMPRHHYGRNKRPMPGHHTLPPLWRPMPNHHTLRLDRVGWPSPPASYKYRGRTREN